MSDRQLHQLDGAVTLINRTRDGREVSELDIECWRADCDFREEHSLDYGVAIDSLMDHLCEDPTKPLGCHGLTPPVYLAVDL